MKSQSDAAPEKLVKRTRDTSVRRDRVRRAILEAAIREFADRGYHAVSTREIAARAGVSNGLPYRYFPSIDALAAACMEYGGKIWQQARVDYLDRHPTSNLTEYIVEYMVFVRQFISADKLGIYQFYKRHVDLDDFPFLQMLDDVSTPEPDFDHEVSAAFARGEIRDDVPVELAQYIVDMVYTDIQETLYYRTGERDFGLTAADDDGVRVLVRTIVRTALAGILK